MVDQLLSELAEAEAADPSDRLNDPADTRQEVEGLDSTGQIFVPPPTPRPSRRLPPDELRRALRRFKQMEAERLRLEMLRNDIDRPDREMQIALQPFKADLDQMALNIQALTDGGRDDDKLLQALETGKLDPKDPAVDGALEAYVQRREQEAAPTPGGPQPLSPQGLADSFQDVFRDRTTWQFLARDAEGIGGTPSPAPSLAGIVAVMGQSGATTSPEALPTRAAAALVAQLPSGALAVNTPVLADTLTREASPSAEEAAPAAEPTLRRSPRF